jgi:hypothetical protein
MQVILDEVAAEMNRIVALFRKHCRHFSGASRSFVRAWLVRHVGE